MFSVNMQTEFQGYYENRPLSITIAALKFCTFDCVDVLHPKVDGFSVAARTRKS